jgi:hypothetical protein
MRLSFSLIVLFTIPIGLVGIGCELRDDSCELYTFEDSWRCKGTVLTHASRLTCQHDEDVSEVDCAATGQVCVDFRSECTKPCAADNECDPGTLCSLSAKTVDGRSTCQPPLGEDAACTREPTHCQTGYDCLPMVLAFGFDAGADADAGVVDMPMTCQSAPR